MAAYAAAALIAVQLTSAAPVPSATLTGAKERAAHILASAHVKIRWVERANLQVRITPEELPAGMPDAMGFAILPPGLPHAAVSWPAVLRNARQMEADAVVVLGAAVAHEIGHLLFGPSHARSGIMSPRLGSREIALAARGELRFEGH